jgi:hypothetical protein
MGTMMLLYTRAHRGSSDVLDMVTRFELPVELLNADVVDVRNFMVSRSITRSSPSIVDLQPDGEVGLIQGATDCLAFLNEQFKDRIQPKEDAMFEEEDPYATMQPQMNPVGYQPMVNAFTTTKNNIEPTVRIGSRKEASKEMSIMERAKQMNKERDDSLVAKQPPFA